MGGTKGPWFGFSRREQGVVLALVMLLAAGIGTRIYRRGQTSAPRVSEGAFFSGLALSEPESSAALQAPGVTAGPVLPRAGRAPAAADRAVPPGPVNINRATQAELETLPQIGPALAGRILAYRRQQGPFRRPEDILKIKGIGEKKYKKLAPFITVE